MIVIVLDFRMSTAGFGVVEGREEKFGGSKESTTLWQLSGSLASESNSGPKVFVGWCRWWLRKEIL